jgi:FMN-dependent NADH-azoreductase
MTIRTILRIDCSPRGAEAHCWRMADVLQARMESTWHEATTIRRVLSQAPPPFVDAGFAAAMGTNTSAHSASKVAALAASEELIRELETASSLIIATPMHNYTVPAVLKAWIDQVVRFGRTFTSTPQGKVGNLADRPAYVVVSSGGFYSGDLGRQPDFLTPYLTAILATIGITSVTFIRMEGLTRGDEPLARAYANARAQIEFIKITPV